MKDLTKNLIHIGIYGVVAGITGYTGYKMSKPYLTKTIHEEGGSYKMEYFKSAVMGAGIGLAAAATGLTVSQEIMNCIENGGKQPLITSKDE